MKVFKALLKLDNLNAYEIITIETFSLKMAQNRIKNKGQKAFILCEEKEFQEKLNSFIDFEKSIGNSFSLIDF